MDGQTDDDDERKHTFSYVQSNIPVKKEKGSIIIIIISISNKYKSHGGTCSTFNKPMPLSLSL